MIKRKKKICSSCKEEKYLWKSSPPLCKECSFKEKPVKIKPFSKKRKVQNDEYLKLRKDFLDQNPICQLRLQGCTYNSTEIEHRKGRVGELLTDTQYWFAICRNCHNLIETTLNREALDKGIKIKR